MVNLRGCPQCIGGRAGRIKVNYTQMLKDMTNSGIIGPNVVDMARLTEQSMKKVAPRRSGRLINLMYRVVLPPVGMTRNFYVGTKAGYAPFTLTGTAGNGSGCILPKRGKELELRPAPYSYFGAGDPRRFQSRVRGQKGRDWMKEGLFLAMSQLPRTGRPG